MSINVTVTGNPVSIRRGKMVSADPDYAKKEFQRRRRMRLEQVRQQSKDIAENVRSKVRKEKSKQLSEIEQEGANKLKEWQNQKLLELQQHYCESLRDIGLGHSAATVEETREDLISAYKDVLREKSKERGFGAAKHLHDEKDDNTSGKALKLQKREDVRNIENIRSPMVSKIKSKSKRSSFKKRQKEPTTNINISNIVEDSESCLDSDVSLEAEGCHGGSQHLLKSDTEDVRATTLYKMELPKKSQITYEKQLVKKKRKFSPIRTRTPPSSSETDRPPIKYPQKIPSPSPTESHINFPLDTRISDHIKRRLNIPLSQPISKCYLEQNSNSKVTQNNSIMDEISTQSKIQPSNVVVESITKLGHLCNQPSSVKACLSSKSKQNIHRESVVEAAQFYKVKENIRPSGVMRHCNDIPEKPKITVKTSLKTNKFDGGDFNKVQYYDHNNHFSKEYLCDNSCVQKIQNDSIQICSSPSSEKEFMENIYKRDRDALERGKKAMEKEKIHRDYTKMMQQLPILQRQERIASISTNNPIFHLSDERLKLYELKRQNEMEEAYEKCFPQTSLITIPPKKHEAQTEPFQITNVASVNPEENLATWDVDSLSRDIIITRDDGLISVGAATIHDRTDYLKNLLEKLKMQREMLLREVDSLPKDSNLHNHIKKFEASEDSKEMYDDLYKLIGGTKKKTNSNSTGGDEYYCPDAGPSKSSKDAKKVVKSMSSQHLRKHKILLNSSNSSSSLSLRKKTKHKKHFLILQNTSTQTTPKKSLLTSPSLLDPKTTQQPQEQTISSDVRHFEIQIEENELKSPKKKFPEKKIASSQTDFIPQSKALSSVSQKDRINTKTKLLETEGKDKKLKANESHSLLSNKPSSPRSKHSKNTLADNAKTSCACSDEVCEILIKIKDEEPEIVIKSPKKIQKSLLVKADVQKNIKKKPQSMKHLQFQADKPSDVSKDKSKINSMKTTSWKEYFNKNNSLSTSTSTSYYSPPHFISSIKNNLSEQLDPRLLTYIKKLLRMSRASVEDLGISTVSEISTPTPSFESNGRNDPQNQLGNIIKYFNLNPHELAQCLNYSNESEENTRASTTSASSFFISSQSTKNSKETDASGTNMSDHHSSSTNDKNISVKFQSESQKYRVISAHIEKTVEQTTRNIEECNARQTSLDTYTDQSYPCAFSKYSKIAEGCHQRISNLSEMIEKVRQEKHQMLSPNISAKENSTSYINLPSQLETTYAALEDTTARPTTHNLSVSSSSEAEQSELTRKLLEIDYSSANKLQTLNSNKTKKQFEQLNEPQTVSLECDTIEDIDIDLITRYRALLNDDYNISSKDGEEKLKKHMEIAQTNQVITSDNESSEIPFVPLLLDVPRLPKLTLSSTNSDPKESENQTKSAIQDAFSELNRSDKKPPPSKGLSAAKKFNNDITSIPHELSTIVEVDSQLSTKVRQSTSPVHSGHQVFENMKPLVVPPNPQNSIWTTQTATKPLSDESLPYILTELLQQPFQSERLGSSKKREVNQNKENQSNKSDRSDTKRKVLTQKQLNMYQMAQVTADQSTDSSTDRSELENVEVMLKSMGMGWAVATIRKTQEALTRASSSSSMELSITKQETKTSDKSNSSSDVNLHQLHIISPFLPELQEISGIQGSGGSSETKNQRTSTPVQTTKSSDKSKNDSQRGIFPIESDLSSVKSKSDDMFMTIPSDISTTTGSQSKSSDQ